MGDETEAIEYGPYRQPWRNPSTDLHLAADAESARQLWFWAGFQGSVSHLQNIADPKLSIRWARSCSVNQAQISGTLRSKLSLRDRALPEYPAYAVDWTRQITELVQLAGQENCRR